MIQQVSSCCGAPPFGTLCGYCRTETTLVWEDDGAADEIGHAHFGESCEAYPGLQVLSSSITDNHVLFKTANGKEMKVEMIELRDIYKSKQSPLRLWRQLPGLDDEVFCDSILSDYESGFTCFVKRLSEINNLIVLPELLYG